ncbi:MAG: hypothetical protein IJL07_00760 [Lachnospiraceae bacterium]|nr:hypothetical protein [Lachnospiraceae bacterium]MBQ6089791.1 hypothetical protein [Lachnospiraceae bacterium]MBR5369210.1 hypothetical protein [Lachnospiraceae bacterium]
MACFTVSLAEAIVVKVVQKRVAKKEKLAEEKHDASVEKPLIPMSTRLGWLTKLLFGGSALLAFEHVWHGEVVPWFPFLTAMNDSADAVEMLQEIGTVGVGMAALVTAVWFVMSKTALYIVGRPELKGSRM